MAAHHTHLVPSEVGLYEDRIQVHREDQAEDRVHRNQVLKEVDRVVDQTQEGDHDHHSRVLAEVVLCRRMASEDLHQEGRTLVLVEEAHAEDRSLGWVRDHLAVAGHVERAGRGPRLGREMDQSDRAERVEGGCHSTVPPYCLSWRFGSP